jgi:hypothetical protein
LQEVSTVNPTTIVNPSVLPMGSVSFLLEPALLLAGWCALAVVALGILYAVLRSMTSDDADDAERVAALLEDDGEETAAA